MNKKILGLSIVEALVATVIVGIGFVAVLQMTSFAVTSIDTSGERTKANYIVSMIAEDIIGHRDSDTQTGNKLADELVVAVLVFLVPLVLPVPVMFLGLFTSAIQALIFATLAAYYIGEAVEEHH